MLRQVNDSGQFVRLLQLLAEQAESGYPIVFDHIVPVLQGLRPPEFRHLSAEMIEVGSPYEMILSAFLVHHCPMGKQLRDLATRNCKDLIEGSCSSNQARVFFFRVFTNLEQPPHEFWNLTKDALKASDVELRIAAAGLAGKLDVDRGELLPLAVPMLHKIARDEDSPWRHLAATELVAHPINRQSIDSSLSEYFGGANEEQLSVVFNRFHPEYRKSSQVLDLLKNAALSSDCTQSLRAAAFYNLARIAFDDEQIHGFLSMQMEQCVDLDDAALLILGIGRGLSAHELPIPHSVSASLVRLLNSAALGTRRYVATVLLENSCDLTEHEYRCIAQHIHEEDDASIVEDLFSCLFRGNHQSIVPAFKAIEYSDRTKRANWIGLLAQLLERFPQQFWEAYSEHRSMSVDAVLPWALTQVSLSGQKITSILTQSLASESELERANALLAIRNSGSGIAAVTPALIELFLRGTGDERLEAFDALARIGNSGQVYAADFVNVATQTELDELRRIQRIMGVREEGVKDIEFARIGDHQLIRRFYKFASALDELGPCGLNVVTRELKKQLPKDQQDKKRTGISDKTISRAFKDFTSALSMASSVPILEDLIVSSDRKWSYVTDTGRVWLDRIRDYLAIIDGEKTGHS